MTTTLPTIRRSELERVFHKYPDRIPVVITRSLTGEKDTPDIKRHKFLVPNHFTFAEVIYMIRKWIALPPEKGMYVFVTPPDKASEVLPSPSALLSEIHQTYKHFNGVLYTVYALENTFG